MEFTFQFIKIFFLSIYIVLPLLVFLSFLILSLGQLVRIKEKWSIFDGVYWTFITASTVGYGDIRPLRKFSKVMSVLIALLGIMFTGVIVAITLSTTQIVIEKHFNNKIIEKIKNL